MASSLSVTAAAAEPAALGTDSRGDPVKIPSSPVPRLAVNGHYAALSGTENGSPPDHAADDPVLQTRSQQELRAVEPPGPASNPVQEEPVVKTDRQFQLACQFHRRGGLDQAIALYRSVLKEHPAHARARFNLVAAYLQSGAYSQAYPMAEKLLSEDPTNGQVMLNLAIAHIGCGRDRQALELLHKAAKLPDAPLFEIVFHKAVALSHLRGAKAALASYKQAEILRPGDPGLLFNMAVAYDELQQYGTAVKYYIKYLEHVTERDEMKIKQVRRRIRTLRAYGAAEKLKERVRG